MARILIAEDDPAQRSMVTSILEMAGHTVVETTDGERALAAATSQTFDAILLDVMMPGLSGYEVLEQLAEREGFTTPIVMVTASNTPSGIAREARAGALEHVSKPYRVDELEATIARVLSLSPEERTRRAAALRRRADTYDAVANLRETLDPEDESKRRRR